MSREVGAYCETCGEHSGTCYNHGEEIIREMYNAVWWIRQAGERCSWLEIRCIGDSEGILGFLLAHEGHNLHTIDEYGHKEKLGDDTATLDEQGGGGRCT